jgi:hypothetical protein
VSVGFQSGVGLWVLGGCAWGWGAGEAYARRQWENANTECSSDCNILLLVIVFRLLNGRRDTNGTVNNVVNELAERIWSVGG